MSEAETVRCVLERSTGEVLLLQKSATSKAAFLFEFPGGKIAAVAAARSTLDEQRGAVVREVREETGVDVSAEALRKLDEFCYSFEHRGTGYSRRVHLFHVVLPVDEVSVIVDSTLDAHGASEDKHQRYLWVSKDALRELRDQGRLSGNSRRFGGL